MTGKPGVFLSPEESLRLAMVDNTERERMIEAIVAHLRAAVRARNGKEFYGSTPREWYQTSLGGRSSALGS